MTLQLNGTTGLTFNDGSLQPSAASGENLIINGNMNIAQRATSVTGITSGNLYRTVDRWRSEVTTAGTWSQSQATDVPPGQGFATSLKMRCTTADTSLAAADRIILGQRFEGFNVQSLAKGTSAAKPITLSFWVKSAKAGTYIVELFDSPNSRQVSKAYTIDSANTWEYKTITYPADTTGVFANDNSITLMVQFWLAAGSTYASGTLNTSWAANTNANRAVGQVNLADSTSNYINITGAQLEVGSTATPFQHLQYEQQFALCQRYFYVIPVGAYGFPCPSTGGFAYIQRYDFKVSMRASPTMSWNYTSSSNLAAINPYSPNVDYVTVQYVGTTSTNTVWGTAISTADAEI